MTETNSLRGVLEAGYFAITAETSPPDAADAAAVIERAGCLKGVVDAVNVTYGAVARAHMSALACSAIMAREGIEPVLQFTTRDRNRLALQGDLIGAAALGVKNILCLGGDDITKGDQPDAKAVRDIDSRTLITTAKVMRDDGRFPSGREIDPKPDLFIGAADTPHDPDPDFTPDAVLAKIDSGADFFQTQYAFDTGLLRRYMARLVDADATERAFFIVGLGPLASAKSAKWMDENLFGVNIPDAIIKRLEGAKDERAEGQAICIELLEEFRDIEGVHGAHLMGPRQERAITEIVTASGIRAERRAVAN